MPICNPITKEKIHEINACLNEEEKARNKKNREMNHNDIDSYIDFMNAGLEKIEASPTKHLMFAGREFGDD